MSLANDFEKFCSNIQLDNRLEMETSIGEIAKKLNKNYYDIENDKESHMYIVGSVGRMTAVKGSSDVDILFDLPKSTYKKFNSYESNGQSALLQEVKNILMERYPKTDIRGDGQVVVIDFNKYTIELVPGFKQTDDRFLFPDTHDGGSWKYTDPLNEQKECSNFNEISNGIYYDFCHIIRLWKNTINLEIGGLLIDTLVYNSLNNNDSISELTTDNYLEILTELFKYLKDQDPDQSYWYAVGSNQHVYNTDDGAFVSEAEQAFKRLDGLTNESDGINDILRDLLGDEFPVEDCNDEIASEYALIRKMYSSRSPSEEFIEEEVTVSLQYNLYIDCKVSQNGWRTFFLRSYLKKGKIYYDIIKNWIFSLKIPIAPNLTKYGGKCVILDQKQKI